MNIKQTIVITAVILTALLALGGGVAFAQTQQPNWGGGFGPGSMMGGNAGATWGMAGARSMMGGGHMGNGAGMAGMQAWMRADNGPHTLVWNALAGKLGLTTDELSAQLAQGQTLAQVAEAQGVSQANLSQTLQTAAQAGLNQAVAEGVLTQAQADQMLTHMAGRYEQMLLQMGAGGCHSGPTAQANS